MNIKHPDRVVECKVCSSESHLYGVCDFNKNCEEHHGVFLELTGVPIYYHRCDNCGLIFTTAFDDWTFADFEKYIYNSEYGIVDPEWHTTRPDENAAMVAELFSPCKLIDYGSGSGGLSARLSKMGFETTNYDPYFSREIPNFRADLVTCFEVYEHTTNPHITMAHLESLIGNSGKLLVSTLAVDFLTPRAMDASNGASYISPRNGHVTIHTNQSLILLHRMHGLELNPITDTRYTDKFIPGLPRFFTTSFI